MSESRPSSVRRSSSHVSLQRRVNSLSGLICGVMGPALWHVTCHPHPVASAVIVSRCPSLRGSHGVRQGCGKYSTSWQTASHPRCIPWPCVLCRGFCIRAVSCGFEAACRRQYLVDRVRLHEQYLRAALGASKQQGEHGGETYVVTTIYNDKTQTITTSSRVQNTIGDFVYV